MNRSHASGKVFLVGAGPGNPGLLTLKALAILQTADVVLHDDLVTPEILALVRTPCLKNVGKRCGQKQISQEGINEQMIEFAQFGLTVARLKGGDPLIFGRVAEEIAALRAAGIAFEIVPGVTAASAAAAAARVPLTDRYSAPHLMFIAGHHCSSSNALPEQAISPRTTLVVHMPGPDYARASQDLLAAGAHSSTPCLIVSCASQHCEEIRHTTVSELSRIQPLRPPAILLVGNAAAHYRALET